MSLCTTDEATSRQPGPWLTLVDAGQRAGVRPKTVRRWISLGLIAGYRSGPRTILVDSGDLESVLARRIAPGGGAA